MKSDPWLDEIRNQLQPPLRDSLKGGQGSGFFNHAGRPGLEGGSAGENLESPVAVRVQKFIQSYPVLYHLTSKGNRDKIIKSGGLRQSKTGYSGTGVYLATTPRQTQYYETLESGDMIEVDTAALISKYGLYHYKDNPTGKVEYDDDTGEVLVKGDVPKDMFKGL